jgi:sirohydrochlorin cobaltochelatase
MSNSTTTSLVLFAHGSRNKAWRAPFEQIAKKVAAQTHCVVELAFLELMEPSLPQILQAMAQQNTQKIVIVPLFFGLGNHVANDLTALVDAFTRQHPSVQVDIKAPLGESDVVLNAMADYATQSLF